jgi:cytochrome c
MCHAPDGSKIVSASGSDMLKGQSAADIEAKLKGYADGSYGGKKAKIMQKIASKLSADELTAVSEHIGSL